MGDEEVTRGDEAVTIHACLFEAKSIQDYLFQSGRLRDVVGASELIDSLTEDLLDDVLDSCGLEQGREIEFSRRAGGAFYAFGSDAEVVLRFRDLWTLVVQQYAPGLAYDIGYGEGSTHLAAFDDARRALRADGSRYRPRLPVGAPVAERSRRTGLVAEGEDGDAPADAVTLRRKQFSLPARAGFVGRFSPSDSGLDWSDWPRNLEAGADGAFPFLGDRRTVALIHADGNGLGQLLMNARAVVEGQPERFVGVFHAISEGIRQSTQESARQAVHSVLLPARSEGGPLPARPILLGGDDLTILVRADLALPFLQVFASAFEKRTADLMNALAAEGISGLPAHLTVGSGVVYLRASQPFYLASLLAESLMVSAKSFAKTMSGNHPPSAVAFHRVTSSLVDEYEAIVERERSHRDGTEIFVDTLGTYLLDSDDHRVPKLFDLFRLQGVLQQEGMARGPTRQLLTLLGTAAGQARHRYRRWRQLMQEHRKHQLQEFDTVLGQLLGGAADDSLPFGLADREGRRRSPLGDVLALMAVGNTIPEREPGARTREDAA